MMWHCFKGRRQSNVVSRSSVGRRLVVGRSSIGSRSVVGRLLLGCWLVVGRSSVDCRSVVGRHALRVSPAVTRLTVYRRLQVLFRLSVTLAGAVAPYKPILARAFAPYKAIAQSNKRMLSGKACFEFL